MDKLEGFTSMFGPDFYQLPRNESTITLRRESWMPPESFPLGDAVLKPLAGGEVLQWRMV
jgi:dihydroorotase